MLSICKITPDVHRLPETVLVVGNYLHVYGVQFDLPAIDVFYDLHRVTLADLSKVDYYRTGNLSELHLVVYTHSYERLPAKSYLRELLSVAHDSRLTYIVLQ